MQDKLYVVTRQDMSPGAQATQSTHAAFQFAVEHPLLTERWYQESKYLVLLSVPDEASLGVLAVRLDEADLVYTVWREPDWGDQITAIAVEPCQQARIMMANLPLTLREPAMVT